MINDMYRPSLLVSYTVDAVENRQSKSRSRMYQIGRPPSEPRLIDLIHSVLAEDALSAPREG